jgi:hypothetical protein
MRRLLLVLLHIIIGIVSKAQKFPDKEILQRIIYIKVGNNCGTGFVAIYKNKSYLITAAHLFDSRADIQKLEIRQDTSWKLVDCKVYFSTNKKVDAAVLSSKLLDDVHKGIYFGDSSTIFAFGDIGFFFGYPFGYGSPDHENVNGGFPLPIIKRATLAGDYDFDGVNYFLLDGFNNPGFSGGPVLFHSTNPNKGDSLFLIGVVKGYLPQYDTIYIRKSQHPIIKKAKLPYKENSGIFAATEVQYVVEIIEGIKK